MKDIVIRQAEEKDYDELIRLYNIFTETDRSLDHTKDGFTKVLADPRAFLFVAEDVGTLVGFAMLTVRDVVRYPKPIAELDELFVIESHRKHGIGKRLVLECEAMAKELNCQRLYLESHMDRTTAHAFYESMGYEKYGFCFKKEL